MPHSSTGPQSWTTYTVEYVENVGRVRSIKAESAEHAEKLVRAEVQASQTAGHRVIQRHTDNWSINVND
ncbi:hypothetical protein [Rhodopirellula sp. SWK7]|uniref:hypothetical protein n=1 Tax=Rhodopirellula sp. SWK7 TaxID=595460 RepID=UPI001181965E|nr:hypothetical protein [Rhodopirellula sp. SWK7]